MAGKTVRTCFVIGPIGGPGTETRKSADYLLNGIIRPAIEDFMGLRIWRADEDTLPGMITDKLINDLHDCDLVVADLSELNPNAFYELGIRHATAKATIHVASVGTKLPFDNMGHRAIFFDRSDWQSIEQARQSLRNQCEEAFSQAYQPSNPVTQALSVKAFRASPRSEEKTLGDLMERVQSVEAHLSQLSRVEIPRTSIRDFASMERERKLFSSIKTFSEAKEYEHLRLTNGQIKLFSEKNCDEENFQLIIGNLKSGNAALVLESVAEEIPF